MSKKPKTFIEEKQLRLKINATAFTLVFCLLMNSDAWFTSKILFIIAGFALVLGILLENVVTSIDGD